MNTYNIMNKIARLACFILVPAILIGCDNKIDNPGTDDNPPADQEETKYTVTATILSTKVAYTDDNDAMSYAWEKADVGRKIVVYDGENSYDFLVESVEGTKATISYTGEIANPAGFSGTAVLSRDASQSRQACNGSLDA